MYSEKNFLSATLFTTNRRWSVLGSNPGRHGRKPAVNHLNYLSGLQCLRLKSNFYLIYDELHITQIIMSVKIILHGTNIF
jgi:hypothetical protein